MRTIRVGTDCSGIEAPIQALQNLGIPFTHEFACEIDPYCRQSIEANYSPNMIFENIKTRDPTQIPPIDLYVCGFPCQSFSSAGDREGLGDPRGTIFMDCVKAIATILPQCFILENVKGICSGDGGRTFERIVSELGEIGSGLYNVHVKLLNTKDYGIPQNRERVYFVGIRKDNPPSTEPFTWPNPVPMTPLVNYVDRDDTNSTEITYSALASGVFNVIPPGSVFIDVGFLKNKFVKSHRWSPTLNAQGNLWCVPQHRKANIKELLALQGFPTDFIRAVSERRLKRQIGNSMSVNVLEAIMKQIYNIQPG